MGGFGAGLGNAYWERVEREREELKSTYFIKPLPNLQIVLDEPNFNERYEFKTKIEDFIKYKTEKYLKVYKVPFNHNIIISDVLSEYDENYNLINDVNICDLKPELEILHYLFANMPFRMKWEEMQLRSVDKHTATYINIQNSKFINSRVCDKYYFYHIAETDTLYFSILVNNKPYYIMTDCKQYLLIEDSDKKVINQVDNSFKCAIRKSLYYLDNDIYSVLQNNTV